MALIQTQQTDTYGSFTAYMHERSGDPVASIVLSIKDGEVFTQRAIDSITAQTVTDFEFIIINDGSTDNTFEVVEQLSQKYDFFGITLTVSPHKKADLIHEIEGLLLHVVRIFFAKMRMILVSRIAFTHRCAISEKDMTFVVLVRICLMRNACILIACSSFFIAILHQ